MRYYFNLVNPPERISDSEGVEAASLLQAEEQALTAIEELRNEEGSNSLPWTGWSIEVTDAFPGSGTGPASATFILNRGKVHRTHFPRSGSSGVREAAPSPMML